MADDFELNVNDEDIQQIVNLGLKAVSRSIELVATDVWGNVGREAPVDTGRLAGGFQVQRVNALEWSIFTNVLYALFVQEGTGVFGPNGQPIVPRRASVLVFDIGGQTIFARSVRGMEANPYVDRAIDRTERRIDEFAAMALQEVGA